MVSGVTGMVKGITRKQQTYQVTHGSQYLGVFTSFAKAVKCKAEAAGISVSQLLNQTRKRSKFEAQDPTSGMYLGVAGTMKEATDQGPSIQGKHVSSSRKDFMGLKATI